jgi:hypothetical protein
VKCVYPIGSKCVPGDRCQFPARCGLEPGKPNRVPAREDAQEKQMKPHRYTARHNYQGGLSPDCDWAVYRDDEDDPIATFASGADARNFARAKLEREARKR